MKKSKTIIPDESIARRILFLRGQKIIIDTDLALLYGVSTKQLNQQIRRNSERFPSDFMFELSEMEKEEVVTNCDHLKKLKFSPYLPSAFTEYGALMAANKTLTALSVGKEIRRTVQHCLRSNKPNASSAGKTETSIWVYN